MGDNKRMKTKKEEKRRNKMNKKHINFKSWSYLILIILLLIFLSSINSVSAATLYWVGSNNGNWSDASNLNPIDKFYTASDSKEFNNWRRI